MAEITCGKLDEVNIRVNNKLTYLHNGEWHLAGVRASRKLSNLLDELHKEVVLWREGSAMRFTTKP